MDFLYITAIHLTECFSASQSAKTFLFPFREPVLHLMEADGTYPWTIMTDVSHDGVSCVRSGEIGNDGMTWLQTSLKKAGAVSFWWWAACEEPVPYAWLSGYGLWCVTIRFGARRA